MPIGDIVFNADPAAQYYTLVPTDRIAALEQKIRELETDKEAWRTRALEYYDRILTGKRGETLLIF